MYLIQPISYGLKMECPLRLAQSIHIPIITNPTRNRSTTALRHPIAISFEDWAAFRQSFKRISSRTIKAINAAISPPKGGNMRLKTNAAPEETSTLVQDAPLFFAFAPITNWSSIFPNIINKEMMTKRKMEKVLKPVKIP